MSPDPEARFRINVVDGQYLLMGDDVDPDPVASGVQLFDGLGVQIGRGIGYMQILGDEDTDFVEFSFEYSVERPALSWQDLKATWMVFERFQIFSENEPLEIRTTELEPVVTVTPGPGHFIGILGRNLGGPEEWERHHLILWPDHRDHPPGSPSYELLRAWPLED